MTALAVVGWVLMACGQVARAAIGSCDTAAPVEVESTAGMAGPVGYSTLTLAFAAINGGTHQGTVNVEVCGSTTETGTAALNASGAGSASYSSVSIKPVGGAARTVSGSITGAPLVDFNGADNVTVDGVNGGGNALTLSNASTGSTAGTSTIRFVGGATNDTVTRASILGSSTSSSATAAGTILFSTDTIAFTGNDDNTISFCNIGPAGSNLPSKALMAAGSIGSPANENSGVVIDNNNIFDFFSASSSTSGVNVLGGNDSWTISSNRIYQTAARTFSGAGLRYAGITLNSSAPLGAFTVTGNVIGFGSASGTGATTIAGSTNEFRGIDAPSVSTTSVTSIQGNTISGIVQSTSRNSTSSTLSCFIGIMAGTTDGLFNIGNTSGNTIGGVDPFPAGTIVVNQASTNANTAPVVGIYNFSLQNTNISNNQIGGISIQGTGTVVGFRGILVNTASGLTATMLGNTIAGISDSQVGSYAVYGIQTISTGTNVTGNTIRNLSGASTASGLVCGGLVVSAGTGAAHTIARNTIHSLSNASGATSNAVQGISASLPSAANVIDRNAIHSLTMTSSAATGQLWGISVAAGTATVQNNMVRLGLDGSGGSITTGFSIVGMRDAGAAANYYYNSVYIGGGGVASVSGTFAFSSTTTTVTRVFENNILWNARSNGSGSAANAAIAVGGTSPNPTGLTSDDNDLHATGVGGVTGIYGGVADLTLADWRVATGQDANSIAEDPRFIDPTGPVGTWDLHIDRCVTSPIEDIAIPIPAVLTDFDGETRSVVNPDIGADEKPAGQPCDDGNPCTNDLCDPVLGCIHPAVADGTPCGDAGTECTNQDTCQGGSCQDNGFKAAGTPCGNPGSDQCDDPDTCNGQGTCLANHKPTGTLCDDGNRCTVDDACMDGHCEPGIHALYCDDNDPCTVDTCDPQAGCLHTPLPTLVATGSSPVCERGRIELHVQPVAGATYQWRKPNGQPVPNGQGPDATISNATPAMSGVYTVTVTINGCVRTAEVPVKVLPSGVCGSREEQAYIVTQNQDPITSDEFAAMMGQLLIKDDGTSNVQDAIFFFQSCHGGGMLYGLEKVLGDKVRWIGASAVIKGDQDHGKASGSATLNEKHASPDIIARGIEEKGKVHCYWTEWLLNALDKPKLGQPRTIKQAAEKAKTDNNNEANRLTKLPGDERAWVRNPEDSQLVFQRGGETIKLVEPGAEKSYHAIIWGGYAKHQALLNDIEKVRMTLETNWGRPDEKQRVTTDIFEGDGTHDQNGHPLPPAWHARPATRAALTARLNSLRGILGPNEKFLVYVLSHGGIAPKPERRPPLQGFDPVQQIFDMDLSEGQYVEMLSEYDNQPALSLTYEAGIPADAISVSFNGAMLGTLPGGTAARFDVPESALQNGGNVIILEGTGADILVVTDMTFWTGGIGPIFEPDCNGNGRFDLQDILDGETADADHDGAPDECEHDCDDLNVCTDDVRQGGVCAHTSSPAGTPCHNTAAEACSAADTCDGAGVCRRNDLPDGASCDDGNVCTAGDSCSGGACGGLDEGPDTDGDAHDDACDCAPMDPSAFAAPGDVGTIRFSDQTSLEWYPVYFVAGTGVVYDVVRGLADELRTGARPSEACFGNGLVPSIVTDPQSPPAGRAFYYLVRARDACGAGPLGGGSGPTTVCDP